MNTLTQSTSPRICPGGGVTDRTGSTSVEACSGGLTKSGISKTGLAFAILIPLLLVILLIVCLCRYRQRNKKKHQKPHQTETSYGNREVGYPEDIYNRNRNNGNLKNVAFTSTTTMSSDVLPSNVERRLEQLNQQEKVYTQQFQV